MKQDVELHKDMQAKDYTGGSVLHAACTGGSIECLDFLMELGGKNCDFTSKDSGGYGKNTTILCVH